VSALSVSLRLTLLVATAAAEPERLVQNVEPDKVELGVPFVQTVEVTHSPLQRYELRPLKPHPDFELLGEERHREDSSGRSVTRFTLRWALFRLGEQPLPPVSFEVISEGSATARLTPPPPMVTGVESVAPGAADSSRPFDIRPPVPLLIRSLRILYAVAAAIGVLALGAWVWRRYRQWRSGRRVPAAPPLPLQLRTQMALDALKNEKLPEKGLGREFYFRLSELVRSYLGERYSFEALECTSEELLAALAARANADLPLADLEGFVRSADWVKYAKAPTDIEGCRQALAFVYRLIQATHPKPTLNAERT
jgi:hypothetical protein